MFELVDRPEKVKVKKEKKEKEEVK